ncbi:hypothetical protein ACX841_02835 [Burkholderia pseudomallei]
MQFLLGELVLPPAMRAEGRSARVVFAFRSVLLTASFPEFAAFTRNRSRPDPSGKGSLRRVLTWSLQWTPGSNGY